MIIGRKITVIPWIIISEVKYNMSSFFLPRVKSSDIRLDIHYDFEIERTLSVCTNGELFKMEDERNYVLDLETSTILLFIV